MKPISFLLLCGLGATVPVHAANDTPRAKLRDSTFSYSRMKDVETHINKWIDSTDKAKKQVVVVFDLDNTLMTALADFGSDTWYRWQSKDPTLATNDTLRALLLDPVRYTFLDKATLAMVNDEQYKHCRQVSTEPGHSGMIGKLAERAKVFALTSRSPTARAATERWLDSFNITFRSNPPGGKPVSIESTAFAMTDALRKAKNPSYSGRPRDYRNGIFMTTGFDKGLALTELLDSIYKIPEDSQALVILVDDGKKNHVNFGNAYKDFPGQNRVPVRILYTRIEDTLKALHDKETGLNKGALVTTFMAERWDEALKKFRINPTRCPDSTFTKHLAR